MSARIHRSRSPRTAGRPIDALPGVLIALFIAFSAACQPPSSAASPEAPRAAEPTDPAGTPHVPSRTSPPEPRTERAQASQPDALPFLLGGIQLNEDDHDRWAAALLQANMNTVQVTVYAQQGAWSGSDLWFEDDAPAVLAEIRAAHRHGLEVVLVLRVALSHDVPENRFLWHGLVWPQSEAEVTHWFERYTAFVVKWAQIAEEEGVRVLGIGSEMNALSATLPVEETPALTDYYLDDDRQRELRELVAANAHVFGTQDLADVGASDFESVAQFLIERNRAERVWARAYTFDGSEDPLQLMNERRALLEAQWRALIAAVRATYDGHLTFAANFDSYHEVAFWDALDLLGVNAYFPLRETPTSPSDVDALSRGWADVLDGIAAFTAEHRLETPVLFTELGYTQRQAATAAPWSQNGFVPVWDDANPSILVWSKQPVAPGERAAAVRALHAASTHRALEFAGILYWKLSSRAELGRYEPFMLDIGPDSVDPLLGALSAFGGAVSQQGNGASALPALHHAARRGDVDETRRLLEAGASLAERDRWGALPLHWACHQTRPEMAALLMPEPSVPWLDDSQESPLGRCARLNNVAIADAVLGVAGDSERVTPVALVDALRQAAEQASLEMVSLLLDAGAVPDALGSSTLSPLHSAARRGESEILERCLSRSTRNDVRDHLGVRPLEYAAYFGHTRAFDLLWADALQREATGNVPSLLHHAAHGGDLDILDTLLNAGLRADTLDSDGRSPLHVAVTKGHPLAVSLLLDHGAHIDTRDGQGLTALHLAASRADAEILRHVLHYQPTPDRRDLAGNTALHYAAGWGRTEHIAALLGAGANPALQNDEGKSAFDVAASNGRRRAALLLSDGRQLTPDSGSRPD